MTPICHQVHAFTDGQLPSSGRAAFEDHLALCRPCAAELEDIIGLAAIAPSLPRSLPSGKISHDDR